MTYYDYYYCGNYIEDHYYFVFNKKKKMIYYFDLMELAYSLYNEDHEKTYLPQEKYYDILGIHNY